MVRAFLSFAKQEVRGMHEAAYLLAAFAFGSQLLALVRDRLLAANFGASHTLDVYYAAFRIPDFLFATVASLLSLYALLPILSRLEVEGEGQMVSFLRQALLVFFVAMSAISVALFFLAPILAPFAAPGLENDSLIMLTRILLLQPILLGASNIVASLTQLRHRFFLYSISPLLYNFGIIVGIVFLYPLLGVPGLAWGVVLGAALHLGVQLPFFGAEKTQVRVPLKQTMRRLFEVLALSIPRTFTLATGQLSLFILVAMASFFAVGSISIFMFAWNLQSVPLAIIGVSYSVAAFPTLSRLYAAGEKEAFSKHIEAALRHILFWSIPATIFIIVLRAQLVRVILGAGAFSWPATRLTAAALALFVVSLAAQSITLLIARAYYAAGNTKKPLYFAAMDVTMSVVSAVALVLFFNSSAFMRSFIELILRVDETGGGTSVLMLALGLTLGSIAEFFVAFRWFVRDFSIPIQSIRRLAFQSFAASIIGAWGSYTTLSYTGAYVNINTLFGVFAEGAVAGIIGICITIAVLLLLKNQELQETIAALRRRFKDAPPIAVEATDVSS